MEGGRERERLSETEAIEPRVESSGNYVTRLNINRVLAQVFLSRGIVWGGGGGEKILS